MTDNPDNDYVSDEFERGASAARSEADTWRREASDLLVKLTRENLAANARIAALEATLRMCDEAMDKALEILTTERWQGRVIDDLNEARAAAREVSGG